MKRVYLYFLYFLLCSPNLVLYSWDIDFITKNRFLDVHTGVNFYGIVTDINETYSDNQNKIRFDFGMGFETEMRVNSMILLVLELSYLRKGTQNTLLGYESTIRLDYFSIGNGVKIPIMKNNLLIFLGFNHNFLINGSGRINTPYFYIEEEFESMNTYDFSFRVGIEYVFFTFPNGVRIKGSIRFDFGVINLIKEYRPILYSILTPLFSIGIIY